MTLPKTLAVIAGSAAFAFLPAMAGSATTAEIHKVEVSTHGYDLSKPADAQIVLYKISRAAKKVCGPTHVRQPLGQRVTAQKCHEDAVTRAVKSINAPVLSAAMKTRFDYS